MTWAEKIIALRPITVTGAYLLPVAVAVLLMELFPIGSALAWIAFALAALLGASPMFIWLHALSEVVHSRLGSDQKQIGVARARLASAGFWLVVWCALAAALPLLAQPAFFPLIITPNLMFAFFWLRMNWETARLVLRFEDNPSSGTFWTFIQILYFPIGVWFLHPRLQRLLSASPQNSGSAA